MKKTVFGQCRARKLALFLVEMSTAYTFCPFSDDEYEFEFSATAKKDVEEELGPDPVYLERRLMVDIDTDDITVPAGAIVTPIHDAEGFLLAEYDGWRFWFTEEQAEVVWSKEV